MECENCVSINIQDYLRENPKLEEYAQRIEALVHHFKFIAITWQKSHTNERSINTKHNEAADLLARSKAEEILTKLTQ